MSVSPSRPAGLIDPTLARTVRRPTGDALRRALFLSTLAWVFGSVWLSAVSGTPQTNFANCLGASKFEFGVLTAIPFLASFLSLPASILIERTGRRKLIFLIGLYSMRLLWVPIAIVPMWMYRAGGAARSWAMLVFLALMFVMQAGQSIGGPAWVTWMADLVPGRSRGKYFSRRRQWGIVSGIPAALLAGFILDRYTNGAAAWTVMKWCGLIFIVSSLFGLLDIHLFQYVPEIHKKPRTEGGLLSTLHAPLHDKRFVWFAGFVATMTFAMSFMGQFVTLYVIERVAGEKRGMNMLTQLMMIVAPNLALLGVLGLWGRAADRFGKRPLLKLGAIGLIPVGLGWCFLTPQTMWLGYVLSAAGAALWAGAEVANLNIVLEMSETSHDEHGNVRGGSGYVAINSIIINIAGCLGGLCAGVIAQSLQDWQWSTPLKTFTFYDVLFVGSALLRLVAVVVFLPHVHDEGARPTREALLFMTVNVYNNLFNAIQQPFRMIGLGKREPEARRPAD